MKRQDYLLLIGVLVLVGFVLLLVRSLSSGRGSTELLDRGALAAKTASPAEPLEALTEAEHAARRPIVPASSAPLRETPPGEFPGTSPTEVREEVLGSSRLSFSVVDVAGEPYAEAHISIRSEQAAASTTTDGRGEAFFTGLPAGDYAYRLEAPGHPTLASHSPIKLPDGGEEHVTLHLRQAALSISGRVLDTLGEPVPDITVEASTTASSPRAPQLVPEHDRPLHAKSGPDGSYTIEDLLEGEYALTTLATERYGPAHLVARTGADAADLIVKEIGTHRVYGTVTTRGGEALAGVEVVSTGHSFTPGRTDHAGRYEIHMVGSPEPGQASLVVYRLRGFQLQERTIRAEQFKRDLSLRLDVQLEKTGDTVAVSGNVRSKRGEAVPREQVILYSPSLKSRHSARTDENGDFSIPDVQAASDYEIWIRPEGRYQDFTQRPVDLRRDDEFLRIELDALEAGTLMGRVIDPAGNPIPQLRLWVRSDEARGRAVEFVSDAAGGFVVEDAPEGRLVVESGTNPRLRVTGFALAPGEEKRIDLVVDRGVHTVMGRAIDANGRPVSVAQVELVWSDGHAGLQSTSLRSTVADASGSFRFTEVGPGSHRLHVQATGFQESWLEVDVRGRETLVEVVLDSE